MIQKWNTDGHWELISVVSEEVEEVRRSVELNDFILFILVGINKIDTN